MIGGLQRATLQQPLYPLPIILAVHLGDIQVANIQGWDHAAVTAQ